MNRSAIVLFDIDDTVMQTPRKCPSDVPAEALEPMGFGKDGKPISYSTPQQVAFVRWMQQNALMVAVTARSVETLLRTRLGFDMAVASHGGTILMEPRPDKGQRATISPEWHEIMRQKLMPFATLLQQVVDEVGEAADQMGIKVRPRIIEELGVAQYVVVKHGSAEPDDAELFRACKPMMDAIPEGWTVHVNGNNVAFMPPGLGKEHAVAWLLPQIRQRLPGLPVIGVGDSFTDAPFMALCDFAMTPTGSQLASRLATDTVHRAN